MAEASWSSCTCALPYLQQLVGPITTAAAAAAAVSAADAECIVSVIVLMVSRLDKDGSLAETASKLANSIGKQVRRCLAKPAGDGGPCGCDCVAAFVDRVLVAHALSPGCRSSGGSDCQSCAVAALT